MPETPTMNDAVTGNNVNRDVVSNTNARSGSSRSRRNKRSRATNQEEELGTLKFIFGLA